MGSKLHTKREKEVEQEGGRLLDTGNLGFPRGCSCMQSQGFSNVKCISSRAS